MERKSKIAAVATHVFLILVVLTVLFPVAKVVQVALLDQQTFDMGLWPFPNPDKMTLSNFSDVVGRTKVEGLGPKLDESDINLLADLLAQAPPPRPKSDDDNTSSGAEENEAEREWVIPEAMAKLMEQRRCFACHIAGEQGREGLGGDLRAAQQLGAENIKIWLSAPTRENALILGISNKPTGAMERREIWVFGHQLFNSVLCALMTTMLGIFLACTAAYAFSRFRFPGRRVGLLSFLVVQMFPGTMMMIPLYILVDKLGLLDQLLGLVLVYCTTAIPFCVWMLKGYFDTIPKELEESAIIDGASRLRIFWSIILPLARPAIAVTALFCFMTAWNEFILAATFMKNETSQTLPVMLQSYVSSHTVEWGHFAAGAILISLPVVVLFFVLQRHLVGGLTAGSVKG